jgi:CubicO group peptidase (beta-lactamase class C family)
MESQFLLFLDVPGGSRLYPITKEFSPKPNLEEPGMKIKFRYYLLLLPLLFLTVFFNVPISEAASETQSAANKSTALLTAEDLSAFVDAFVAGHMDQAHAPGLVVAVVYQENILLSQGYGVADLKSARPMTPQTTLRAGSVSKALTSLAVLQLAADGQIALDAPASSYLSGLPLADAQGPAATVAQLLTLKGGYADTVLQTHSPTLEGWQPLDQYLANHLPPRVLPPGKVHSYNSWEHALLGQLMAEVTGRPFDRVMDDTLFRPLGMAHSTFSQPLPEAIAANLAVGYSYADGQYEEVPLDYVNLSPGIALVTTADDMGRFMLALLNGGLLDGRQLIAPSAVEGMLTRQEEVHPLSRGRTYGLSEVTLGGRQVLYQDGNGIGQGSRLILAPEHGLGIFLSVNHRPLTGDISDSAAYRFMKDLSTALLERYLPASPREVVLLPPLTDAAARAPRFAGHYRLAGTPQEDFFKLGALLDNVTVGDNGDGTITIGSNRYAEVEPLLFQSKTDPAFFVPFVEDNQGEISLLTFGGTNSYMKVHWYETPTIQIALVTSIFLSFLAFVILMPFTRYRYWSTWIMSLLGLIFLGGLAYMMTQADLVLFFKTIPPATKGLFLLPWLIGALALTIPIVLLILWRRRPAAPVRILYGLNTAAAAALFWFVAFWNLYQF